MIATLKPELVLQPWTEDPDLATDATAPAAAAGGGGAGSEHALVARLANMQAVADAVMQELPRLEASQSVRRTVREQLAFLGETNLANAAAVRNLMKMGKKTVYAHFGTDLDVAKLLPGVGLEVLGPPTLEQSKQIAVQRATDPDEFWHLARANAVATAEAEADPPPLFPDIAIATDNIPQEARWVIPEIDRMRSEEMLALVRILDAALNNTSLILLFEIGDTLLLFPGDAQIENWSYALFTAPNHKAICKRLASASFYKVGHHGSLNATPKTLWEGFANRSEKPKDGSPRDDGLDARRQARQPRPRHGGPAQGAGRRARPHERLPHHRGPDQAGHVLGRRRVPVLSDSLRRAGSSPSGRPRSRARRSCR